MSVLQHGMVGTSGVDTGDIPASLRFRGAQYLSRTITTDATSTYVMKVKRGKLGVVSPIIETNIRFNANDTLTAFGLTTTAVFRDPTAWILIHISNNGLYVNGQSLGAVTTSAITNGRIGYDGTNYFDGYMARFCVVGGSASAYTDFGYFNTEINEWVSKSQSQVKAVVDAGGTNSFMLDFDDATSLTTLGYDKSSKGNNWTLNNFSLTAGTTYDHMLDVPGNSYATLNPLSLTQHGARADLKWANLFADGSPYTSTGNMNNSLGMQATQPVYFEITTDSSWTLSGQAAGFGFIPPGVSIPAGQMPGQVSNSFSFFFGGGAAWGKRQNGGAGTNISLTNSVAGTVMMVAYNPLTGNAWVGKDGAWNGSGNPSTGANPDLTGISSSAVEPVVYTYRDGVNNNCQLHVNAGQRPFTYTPPTGFKALCQANLPDVNATLLDPADHHVEVLVTKSSTTQNFTLPWDASAYDTLFEIKRRDAAGSWYQIDGLRGYNKYLVSNSTAAEVTDANVLSVSGTTCTLGSSVANGTYLISATKAGLSASRQTNTDGSITSTVSRNVASGFSIVTYTGTGVNATVGHGLGVAPRFVVARKTNAAYWWVWHSSFVSAGNSDYLILNQTGQKGYLDGAPSSVNLWNATAPNATVLSIGNYAGINVASQQMVFYCYADSPIQKSFSHTGNASTDGAYADVGFKMGRALLKCSSTTGNWTVLDSTRSTENVADDVLYENLTNAEATSALADLDSRAIKFRISTDPNSAQTFIGHAWAAVTGKYSAAR